MEVNLTFHCVSFFFFLIEIQLIYNIIFVLGVQNSNPVIYMYILLHILFPYRLFQNIWYSSLCYTVDTHSFQFLFVIQMFQGFSRSSVGLVKNQPALQESACNVGDPGLILRSGISPGEGNGNPLQYFCLENPVERGAWRAIVNVVTRVRHDLATKPNQMFYLNVQTNKKLTIKRYIVE